MLGSILPQRNEAWLNAGPSAWLVYTGDNGDIKFPHRLPIIPETHEHMLLFDVRRQSCCSGVSSLQMTYDMQAGQAVTAGYFGGYSAKMQDVGGNGVSVHATSARKEKQVRIQTSRCTSRCALCVSLLTLRNSFEYVSVCLFVCVQSL